MQHTGMVMLQLDTPNGVVERLKQYDLTVLDVLHDEGGWFAYQQSSFTVGALEDEEEFVGSANINPGGGGTNLLTQPAAANALAIIPTRIWALAVMRRWRPTSDLERSRPRATHGCATQRLKRPRLPTSSSTSPMTVALTEPPNTVSTTPLHGPSLASKTSVITPRLPLTGQGNDRHCRYRT